MRTVQEFNEKFKEILQSASHPLDRSVSVDFAQDVAWGDHVGPKGKARDNYKICWHTCDRLQARELIFDRLCEQEPLFKLISLDLKVFFIKSIDWSFFYKDFTDRTKVPNFAEIWETFDRKSRSEKKQWTDSNDLALLNKIDLSKTIDELNKKHLGSDYKNDFLIAFIKEFPNRAQEMIAIGEKQKAS